MPKADSTKDQTSKSRRDERVKSSAPYPGERMGAIASMLEAGDGSAYMNPEDLEARTAAETEAVGITEEEVDQDKPSFNALTAAEMNVRITLYPCFSVLESSF
jgi:hypothetical protein